ncbi:MFS transporter [Neobacillus massiliamazoniensis]|uniref:Major facilitator family transporter n=1 Tax=Neobacillus massiliamazoniensis TaxID=1499688 RepID=A0A0U1NY68_9BACI|nr:MFS transporter [Neobacillus massiliamazoniensis]CRK82722.1 major facilitator family transporter [Neobacillus massiliamazoniensis]
MEKNNFKIIYTIFVFIALAAFDNIIIGLFPPLFSKIAADLDVNIAKMGVVSAANILVTALSSIYWGYLSGKFKRKKLIIIGTLIWVLSVFLTSISKSYFQLLLFQIITGIGLGCIASIGFSVLTDSIPYRMRGMVLSLWGMTQGLGGIAGALMASLIATRTSWRTPFEIVGFIGFFLIILYLFVEEPTRGKAEPELLEAMKKGQSYDYVIKAKHLRMILFKRSNLFLFLQALFMNISIGSLIWLPTLYIYKIVQQGYGMDTAIIASGYLYAIFQIGGMSSVYFGHLGDRLQKKSFKGRAYLTAIFVFLTMPLYILMFMVPMTGLSLPEGTNAILIFVQLLKQIVTNPWIALLFVLSLFASAAQSANTPNWLALITDVNLPEHRGTAFSMANLSNSLGRTLGNIGVGFLLSIISVHYKEPNSYIITLSLLQVFLIPAALCYLLMAKNNVTDIKKVKLTLKKRAQTD